MKSIIEQKILYLSDINIQTDALLWCNFHSMLVFLSVSRLSHQTVSNRPLKILRIHENSKTFESIVLLSNVLLQACRSMFLRLHWGLTSVIRWKKRDGFCSEPVGLSSRRNNSCYFAFDKSKNNVLNAQRPCFSDMATRYLALKTTTIESVNNLKVGVCVHVWHRREKTFLTAKSRHSSFTLLNEDGLKTNTVLF